MMKTETPLKALGQRTLIMGVINVTPDSFSGDGVLLTKDYIENAVSTAHYMVEEGADIIDIGGESTRPLAQPVAEEEELRRVIPVITALHVKMPDLPISIDTTKPEVARAAIEAGATIINDISGHKQSAEMRDIAKQSGAYLILMHNSAETQSASKMETIGGEYTPPEIALDSAAIANVLAELASQAMEDGVAREKIILDPGIGFGKTLDLNLQLIAGLDQFTPLGFPLLIGPSRKSFIGRVLDLPPEERLEGTAATIAVGIMQGAAIIRVHDVRFMARVVKMTDALKRARA